MAHILLADDDQATRDLVKRALESDGHTVDLTQDGTEALETLETAEPRLARIVDLKYFCGFSFTEIGTMLGISERTVQRDWEKARIYLHRVLRDDPKPA